MTYKLTRFDTVIRLLDGANIPIDPDNRDYIEYLKWEAKGNTPEAADPEPVVPDWKGFLLDLRGTTVFTSLRGQARTDVAANALATELRTLLGEAALGLVEVEAIQELLNELAPALPPIQIQEIAQAVLDNNIPLSLN